MDNTSRVLKKGDLLPGRLRVTVTLEDIKRYADSSGDQNPIHQDAVLARSVGLKDQIIHGALLLEIAGQFLMRLFTPRQVQSLTGSFKDAAYPGEKLIFTGEVVSRKDVEDYSIITCKVTCSGEDGVVRMIARARIRLSR
jgi:acyl dehydratase